MRKFLITIFALIAMCMGMSVALAGGGHDDDDHDDDKAKITKCEVKVDGKYVDVYGKVKGLDKHEKTKIKLIVTGKIKGDCVNPGGNSPKPHSDKEIYFEEEREKKYDKGEKKIEFKFKNIKARVKAGDVCPSGKWDFKVRKIKLKKVLVKVYQDGKKVAYKECL